MSKFFITNKKELLQNVKERSEKAGFKSSFEFSNEGIHALAFHKLKVENINYSVSGDSFCISTGTCIYKESLIPHTVLSSWNDDVHAVQLEAMGQFALSVFKNGVLTVFSDGLATYDVYCYSKEGVWAIGSSLFDMAYALKEQVTLNELNVVEHIAQKSLLNGKSFFDEIHRLTCDEYIRISVPNGEFQLVKIPTDIPLLDKSQYDNAVKQMAGMLREKARIANNILGTPTICATGGLDSRLILAAFLSAGVKPYLYHGVGNKEISNPHKEDGEVAEMCAEKFGLNIVRGDWSIPTPIDKDWANLVAKAGFPTAFVWGASQTLVDSVTNDTTDSLYFGWGGELLRNEPWVDSKLEKGVETSGIEDYMINYYIPAFDCYNNAVEKISGWRDRIKKSLKEVCKRYRIDEHHMSLDDAYFFEREWGFFADTRIPTFFSQYKYVYLLLSDFNLHSQRVGVKDKMYAHFMLDVIHELYSDVFSVPLFTRNTWRVYNPAKRCLESIGYQGQKSFKSRLHDMVPQPIRQYIYHPIKMLFVKQSKKETPIMVDYSYGVPKTPEISTFTYNIDFTTSISNRFQIRYQIILEALKQLGY